MCCDFKPQKRQKQNNRDHRLKKNLLLYFKSEITFLPQSLGNFSVEISPTLAFFYKLFKTTNCLFYSIFLVS